MMNLCFSLYENKFKKKPLPSLSSRKGLTNWRFLLKNNKALCASYFNFQSSIFNSIDYNAPADAPMRNKRKGYQPFINYKFRIASYKLVAHRAMLNYVIINLKFTVYC